MLRYSLKVVTALWGVLFLSAAVAGDGIRLSEWGDATLPEQSVPAKAGTSDTAPELGLGDFLVDEARTFGAGALDGEQLRKALASRAIGEKGPDLRAWMANRWENAPGRFGAHMAQFAEGTLESLSWVENANVRWTPSADDAFGAFSASGVGGLWTGEDSFFGIQPKIRQSGGDMSGTFGVFQRKALGDWAVVGVNAFADYKEESRGSFSRYWLGADFSSAWVDADVKRYFGGDGRTFRRDGKLFRAYTPDGVTGEMRFHTPGLDWLSAHAKFAEWQGRRDNADIRTQSFGFAYTPAAGLRLDADFDGDNVDAKVAYDWTIGKESQITAAEPFGVYSELVTEVDNEDFNVLSYELYELMELNRLNSSDFAELRTAVSLAWQKVPAYLQVSEEIRGDCLPPVFVFEYDYLSNLLTYNALNGQYIDVGYIGVYESGEYPQYLIDWGYHAIREVHFQSRFGNVDNLCHVLFHNDGVNERSSKGATPIFMAIHSGSVDKVRYLILAGADVNAENDNSVRPLGRLQRVWNRGFFGGEREDAEEIARILLANDASCTERTRGEFCSMEKPDKEAYPPFKPVLPSKGGVLPVEVPQVVFGEPGEVFRITATTDFVDVDFRLMDHEEYLTVTINGTYSNCKGAHCFDNEQHFDSSELRDLFFIRDGLYEASGETTVAIVSIHSPIPAGTSITGEIEARFSFYRNARNTVTVGFTLSAISLNRHINLVVGYGQTENLGTVAAGVPDANIAYLRDKSDWQVQIQPDGLIVTAEAPQLGRKYQSLAEVGIPGISQSILVTVDLRADCNNPQIAVSARSTRPTQTREQRNTELRRAVALGNIEQVCELSGSGVDINGKLTNVLTFSVSQWSQIGRIPETYKRREGFYDNSPLERALRLSSGHDRRRRSISTVKALLDAGADPNIGVEYRQDRHLRQPTMMHSLAKSHLPGEVAQLMIAAGGRTDALNHHGETPLMVAAELNREGSEIFDVLLKHTGDKNQVRYNKGKYLIVHLDEIRGRDCLEEREPKHKCKNETAAHYTARSRNPYRLARMKLAGANMDVYILDKNGRDDYTPRTFDSQTTRRADEMEEWLTPNPRINELDEDGLSVLHWAIINKETDFVRGLIENQPNLDINLKTDREYASKNIPVGSTPRDVLALTARTSEYLKRLLVDDGAICATKADSNASDCRD